MFYRSITLVSFLLFLFCCSSSLAQNRFFEEDQKGFSGEARFFTSELANTIGLNGVYSFVSNVDFGLILSYNSFDEEKFGPDFNGFSIAPSLFYAVVKPENKNGFGAELGMAYQYGSFSGDNAYYQGDSTSNSYSLMCDAYYSKLSPGGVQFVPSIRVAYVSSKSTFSQIGESSEDGRSDDIGFGAAFDFVFDQRVVFTPRFIVVDSVTTFGLEVGLLFPGSKF